MSVGPLFIVGMLLAPKRVAGQELLPTGEGALLVLGAIFLLSEVAHRKMKR